ncbi:MAG: mechanosensitive ion channel family protein [Elainellaceae cyanobacterium]
MVLSEFRRIWAIAKLPVISFLTVILVVSGSTAALGQFSLQSSSNDDPSRPPDDVTRYGFVEVAPVKFERKILFEVTSPTVRDRSNPDDIIPVEQRVEQIQVNLQRVIEIDDDRLSTSLNLVPPMQDTLYFTQFDPETFRVIISELNGATILQATDRYRSRPQQLLTVTDLDAQFHGLTIEELAKRWQYRTYQALHHALGERLPGAIVRQFRESFMIALGTAGLSIGIWLLQRLIKAHRRALKMQQATELAASTPSSESMPDDTFAINRLAFLTVVQDQFNLQSQLKLNASLRWLLRWVQVVIWTAGIFWILYRFPQTREVALTILEIPVTLSLAFFLAGLADRLVDTFLDRLFRAWADNQISLFGLEDVQRKSLRASTVTAALRGLTTFIFYGAAILWSMGQLRIPTSSVLTGGAIVGLAISFGSQNLVRDLVTGCLILWEDQYAVGDVIAIGTTVGLVENMNLRITQIRNAEGRLITIPNGAISQVENLTRSWSRVDFAIEVAYDTDIKRAIAILTDVAQEMYNSPDWHDRILEMPDVLGVDQMTHAGILIRVWIKTQPLQQWSVGREFRLRVRLAFEREGIEIGIPQQAFVSRNPEISSQNGASHTAETTNDANATSEYDSSSAHPASASGDRLI